MKTGYEKRRFKRVSGNFPLQYRSLGEEGNPSRGGFTRDIAEGGVRFVTHKFIPLATNLTLSLSLPSTFKPLRALSKVVWVRKLPGGDRYEIGLEFIDVSNDDRGKIGLIASQVESLQV